MNFDFDADDDAFRADVREFLAAELPDDWQGIFIEGDTAQRFSNDFCRALGRRGWLTMSWPEQWGGEGASAWRQVVLQEEMWAHNEPRGAQYMNVNWIGPAIMHFGTSAQQESFLPRIARGEMVWAQAFSEPDAGSDLAALRCRATPIEDGFIVTGEKIWISYADFADYCFLLARSDPEAPSHNGLSVLLVDLRLAGIEVHPIASALGAHRQNAVRFEEAHVPADALLGPLHDGWRVARVALAFERSGSARYARSARILGLLEREVDGTWPPELRAQFAALLADARVAELVNYRVVALKEQGEVPRWEASAARIHNALLEQAIADFAEDAAPTLALGARTGSSVQSSLEIEAFCRSSGAATITAGTYEVQMGIVAREALELSGESVNLDLPRPTAEFVDVLRDAGARCTAGDGDSWKVLDDLGVFDLISPASADPDNAHVNAVAAIEALSEVGVHGPVAETMWVRCAMEAGGGALASIPSAIVADGQRLVPYGMVTSRVVVGREIVIPVLRAADLHAQGGHAWMDDRPDLLSFEELDAPFAWRAAAAGTLGFAGAAFERAVVHARERVQFGRPIGTFQAVQFRLTESAIALDGLRFLVREAAWRADNGDSRAVALSALAWIRARATGRRVSRHVHQVFGAMGFTAEAGIARQTGAVSFLRDTIDPIRAIDAALSNRSLDPATPSSTTFGGFVVEGTR